MVIRLKEVFTSLYRVQVSFDKLKTVLIILNKDYLLGRVHRLIWRLEKVSSRWRKTSASSSGMLIRLKDKANINKCKGGHLMSLLPCIPYPKMSRTIAH